MADLGLEARIAALEAKTRGGVDLADLPLAPLKRWLEQNQQLDRNGVLEAGFLDPDGLLDAGFLNAVTLTLLSDVAVGLDTLAFPAVADDVSNIKTVTHGLGAVPRFVWCQAYTPTANTGTRGVVIEADDSTFTTTQFQCRGVLALGSTNGTWDFIWLAIL